MGDGELQEGSVWEAAMCAKKNSLDHLIAFIDHNNWQSGGSVTECSGLLPVREKWEAFGWFTQEIDGHNIDEILGAIEAAKAQKGRPSAIVARTVKGKGLDYMEDDNSWHKRVPDDAQLERAIELLGGDQK